MQKFTHEASDQAFELSEATLQAAEFVKVSGLGWWANGDDGWFECEEPANARHSIQVARPAGVEACPEEPAIQVARPAGVEASPEE